MKLSLYFRLSKKNIASSGKTFIPYIFAASLSVMMYTIIYTLSRQNSFVARIAALDSLMSMGVYIVGFFSCIFIFYGNKFLIKKRMKEIGLYMLLGLEKKHIAAVLFCEFLFCFVTALLIGSAGALLFGKLAFLLLHYAAGLPTAGEYRFSMQALRSTALVFSIFFLFNYLYNLKRIGFAAPLTLMQEAKTAEKKPRHSWIRTLLAVIFLAAGYITSFRVQGVIEAFKWFLPAVIWVITGTFFLFESLSLSILTRMKRRASYYTPKKFIAVSGMMYRMGQNAKGLASICILLTMVLVTMSFTLSIKGSGAVRAKKEFVGNHRLEAVDEGMPSGTLSQTALLTERIAAAVQSAGIQETLRIENPVYLHYISVFTAIDGNRCLQPQDSGMKKAGLHAALAIVPKEQLVTALKLNDMPEPLNPDELLFFSEEIRLDSSKPFHIGTKQFTIKTFSKRHQEAIKHSLFNISYLPNHAVLIVTANEQVNNDLYAELDRLRAAGSKRFFTFRTVFFWDTDIDAADPARSAAVYAKTLRNFTLTGTPNSMGGGAAPDPVRFLYRNLYRDVKEMQEFEGGFIFLGMFLSMLFLVWMILVMYFKQISEGYEDRRRYQIMLKIGMDRTLIKKTSQAQIIKLFLLPVLVALIHGLCAEPMLFSLLQGFGIRSSQLFFAYIFATGGFISILYLVVYKITAREYYNIVL